MHIHTHIHIQRTTTWGRGLTYVTSSYTHMSHHHTHTKNHHLRSRSHMSHHHTHICHIIIHIQRTTTWGRGHVYWWSLWMCMMMWHMCVWWCDICVEVTYTDGLFECVWWCDICAYDDVTYVSRSRILMVSLNVFSYDKMCSSSTTEHGLILQTIKCVLHLRQNMASYYRL